MAWGLDKTLLVWYNVDSGVEPPRILATTRENTMDKELLMAKELYDDRIASLTQSLYEEAGYSGNIYVNASLNMLRYFLYKAQDILEKEGTESKSLATPK